MTDTQPITSQELQIRHFIYRFFVDHTRPPATDETAAALKLSQSDVASSYRRLHAHHFLFLNPGTLSIRMANPFSAIPTPFVTRVQGNSYWANCAWDMLGIAAALKEEADIRAYLPDSGESMSLAVRDGQLHPPDGVIHFPLPAARWYDDLILT